MATLDEIDRVVKQRLIGSPPHSFQHMGTLEKLNYVGTIGRISRMGTIAAIGTVLMTVSVRRIGTVDEVTSLGTLNRIAGGRVGTLGRLGTVHYVERIGTISHIGSSPYVGTVNRIAYSSRVGTIGQAGTTQNVVRAGGFIGTAYRRAIHLGQGSTWVGSWQHIGSFRTKTFSVMGRGTPGGGGIGSVALMTAVSGTQRFKTGTYFGLVRVGSYYPFSMTESIRYARVLVKKSGTYSGTVSVDIGLNPL